MQNLFLAVLLMLSSQSVQAMQDNAFFSTENLLVSYSEKIFLLRSTEQERSIKIYRGGYVLITVPEAMTMAGIYHTRLGQDELHELWQLLLNKDVLSFDTQMMRKKLAQERRLSKQSNAVVTSVSDKTEMLLEFYPNRYRSSVSSLQGDGVKHIAWSGLRWDTEQYPQIESLQLLSEIKQFILSIVERNDLQLVNP